MRSDGELEQWVIYDHPSDYPHHYVARRWLIRRGSIRAADTVPYIDEYLDNVRRFIQTVSPGLVCLARMPEDDGVVVEVWT